MYRLRKILYSRKRREELKTHGYFDRKIRKTLNELEHEVFLQIQRIKEEESAKGMLQSGMAMQKVLNILGDTIITALKSNLVLIKEFQDEMKITLDKSQLEVIGLKHAELFSSFYIKCTENYYKPLVEDMFPSTPNITNQVLIDSIYNKIRNTAKDYTEDMKVKNALRKDEPSVKNQKRMFILAIVSFVITSIITLVKLHR